MTRRPDVWRRRGLWREARSGIGPRPWLTAVAVVVLAALGLLVMYDASAATQQEAARRLAGSLVWTAKASDSQPLDSQACDGLNRSPGVAAAGGVGATRPPEATAFTGGHR